MDPATDCTLAPFTILTLSVIDAEVMLEIARFSIGFDEISQRRPTLFHRLLEDFLDPERQFLVTRPGNSAR